MTISVCDLCGGPLKPGARAWLARCARCGVLKSDLPVAIPATAGGSALDEARREAGLAALREANNAALLDALVPLAKPGGRLLDVGCGPGFLLSAARARGYDAQGLEPDANVVAAASARGASVRHGYFPAALAGDERFDIIVFNDVLEHIPAIGEALAASAAHLAPQGLLVVNCPDRRGLFYRVASLAAAAGFSGALERLWQKGLPSPHVWYLTPAALDAAAKDRGLVRAAPQLRLATIAMNGLWSRIRYVKRQPLALSLAAYAFAVLTLPLARLLPADASAAVYRKTTAA